MITRLPQLLENAIPLYTEPETNPEKYQNILNWNTYAARAEVGGVAGYVQLTTFDIKDSGTFISIHHDHNFTDEQTMKGSLSVPNSVTNRAAFTASLSRNKLLNWYKKVNENDVSKVVDENGEPLVVYHGTQDDVEVFDKKHSGKRESRRRTCGFIGRGILRSKNNGRLHQ